ncbi:MAG: HU family DNA-binding protein [Acidobacteriota bacterium]
MRKADLAEAAYRRHGGIARKEAVGIVDTILASISRALADKERVVISGFGSFRIRKTRSRPGRNPQTGEELLIPSRWRVLFRPSEQLVIRVNRRATDR